MGNPTVRNNLKQIEELRINVGTLGACVADDLEALRANQVVLSETLTAMIEIMTQEHTVRAMLTHRSKWIAMLNNLKGIANAKNTDEGRDSEDNGETGQGVRRDTVEGGTGGLA